MILCPVDFSPATAALVRVAAGLARAEAEPLTFLHVAPSTGDQAAVGGQLDALRHLPELAGLAVQTRLFWGCPARIIAEQARTLGASLIVLNAHGASGLTRFLMGSTAEAVLRTASCPTLLLTPAAGA
ncbi:MAG: universal stress protein [Hymenobacteraceae bacterium]|nr:universal stress protein [Hymenobacteraceae bacterium]